MDSATFGLGMQGLGLPDIRPRCLRPGQNRPPQLPATSKSCNWQDAAEQIATTSTRATGNVTADHSQAKCEYTPARQLRGRSLKPKSVTRYDRAALGTPGAMSGINAQIQRNEPQHQADIARVNANLLPTLPRPARDTPDHARRTYSLRAGNQKARH